MLLSFKLIREEEENSSLKKFQACEEVYGEYTVIWCKLKTYLFSCFKRSILNKKYFKK